MLRFAGETPDSIATRVLRLYPPLPLSSLSENRPGSEGGTVQQELRLSLIKVILYHLGARAQALRHRPS